MKGNEEGRKMRQRELAMFWLWDRDRRKGLWAFFLIFWSAASPLPSWALPRTILLAVPALQARDLQNTALASQVGGLLAHGAGAWMVCRAASNVPKTLLQPDGRETLSALLLTLGAGSRAAAPIQSELNTYFPLKQGFDGSALNPHLFRKIQQLNKRLGYTVRVGLLGQLSELQGGVTSVIADADTLGRANEALLLGMDERGNVAFAGSRLFCLKPNTLAPYGVEADCRKILKYVDALPDKVSLVVILFFDLERAEREAPWCLPWRAEVMREEALDRLGELLRGLLLLAGRMHSQLLFLSPSPAQSTPTLDRLAPLILLNPLERPGVLASSSTRWQDLVLNIDLLPTIAAYWGIKRVPPAALGRPLEIKAVQPFSLSGFIAFYRTLYTQAELQNLYGGLPFLQLLLLVGGAFFHYIKRCPLLATSLGMVIAALPFALFVLPSLSPLKPLGAGALLWLVLLVVGVLAYLASKRGRNPCRALLAMNGCFISCVLADLVNGSHLMREAWMSYSVMEGARFFGIGNEYMGACVGAAVLLVPWFLKRRGGDFLAITFFCTMVFVMAFPLWGAKVGAIPTGVAAFGMAWLGWRHERISIREILLLLAIAALLLMGMVFLDRSLTSAVQSHLARAFEGRAGGGLASVALRKLRMEGFLLLHSPWSLVLLSGLAIHSCWLRVKQGSMKQAERALWWGMYGGIIAALLFNDAGVPAAALLWQQGMGWTFCNAWMELTNTCHGTPATKGQYDKV